MAGPAVMVFVAGSYSSVLARSTLVRYALAPPAISTLPLGSSVAVASQRAVLIAGPAVKVLVAGSYSSVLLRTVTSGPTPPAISTLPLRSGVAVALARSTPIAGP